MDLSPSNSQSRPRGHARLASADERRRVPMPRRQTKGPLDANTDDPLSDASPLSPGDPLSPLPRTPRPVSPAAASPAPPSPTVSQPYEALPGKDFSYLLHPSNFHLLPNTTIPPAFLTSPHQPPANTPLDTLLRTGHFRPAAHLAAHHLTHAVSPADYPQIFSLLYMRLACLTLINQTPLAADESKHLGDVSSAFYAHPTTGASLLPWALRVLAARLQAVGVGDLRRGVMRLYELAWEAREGVVRHSGPGEVEKEERRVWEERLRDLGVRVAGLLVEMGEVEAAGRHLGTLGDTGGVEEGRFQVMEALVWLRVGDVEAARKCVEKGVDGSGVLDALIQMADGEYDAAVEMWTQLREKEPDNAMVAQNLAVCLLYTGRIAEARTLLSSLVDSGQSLHSLTFNLSTLYELCTEKSHARKMELAERLAAQDPSEVGWEKTTFDLKL